MTRVDTPVVLVVQGETGIQAFGDASGYTSTLNVDIDAPMTMALPETPTTMASGYFQATTIGQQFTLAAGSLSGSSNQTYCYFQPTARLLLFDSLSPTFDGESGYAISPMESSSYQFNAWVAELPTQSVISAYFAYYLGVATDHYKHGILIRTDSEVDLGSEGFSLVIDTAGYGYTPSSVVEAAPIYAGPDPAGNGLSVGPVSIDESNGFQWAHMHVSGVLREGDNLILIKNPNGIIIRRQIDLGRIGWVPAPLPSTICDPDPVTDADCPQGSCDPNPDGKYSNCSGVVCEKDDYWIGVTLCHQCDVQSVDETSCANFSGGIAVSVKNFFGIPGLSVSADGHVGGRVCIGVQPLKGYCSRAYLCLRLCRDVCHVVHDYYEYVHPNTYHIQYVEDKQIQCVVLDNNGNPDVVTSTKSCKFADCPDPE